MNEQGSPMSTFATQSKGRMMLSFDIQEKTSSLDHIQDLVEHLTRAFRNNGSVGLDRIDSHGMKSPHLNEPEVQR